MVDRNNLTDKRWTLKIDIEGGEFVAFRHFPTSYLKNIDQIVMELHPAEQRWYHNEEYGYGHRKFAGNLNIFKTLSEHFYVVNWHYTNNACYNAP